MINIFYYIFPLILGMVLSIAICGLLNSKFNFVNFINLKFSRIAPWDELFSVIIVIFLGVIFYNIFPSNNIINGFIVGLFLGFANYRTTINSNNRRNIYN